MSPLKRVTSFAALLLSSGFAAQAMADTTYVFTSVTGMHSLSTGFSIVGVLDSDTAPAVLPLPTPSDQCLGFIFDVMSTPGTYKLTLVIGTSFGGYPSFSGCSLDRNPGV